MRRSLAVWPSLLALSLLAVPASAEVYRVTLNNGQVFESAYQPQEASWDASMVLLLDEVGNWIGVSKADVQQVATVDETGAFGILISKNTFEIGISANDAAAAAEALAALGAQGQSGADARLALLQQVIEQQQAEAQQRSAQQNYTVKQFVEPNQTQGIPSRFVGQPSGPIPGTGSKQ
jgi:hypothetical protein